MTQHGFQLGDFNPTETEGNHDGSQLSKMEGKKIIDVDMNGKNAHCATQGNLLKVWQPCAHPTKHMGLQLHVIGSETPVKECPMVSNNIFQSPSMALLGFNNSVSKPLP